jgi:hypothetical protein
LAGNRAEMSLFHEFSFFPGKKRKQQNAWETSQLMVGPARVARWWQTIILIWVYFGPWNGKCWYTYFIVNWNILRPFGIFYSHLVHTVVLWYVYFLPFWYIVPRKIWQPWVRLGRRLKKSFLSRDHPNCEHNDELATLLKWLKKILSNVA